MSKSLAIMVIDRYIVIACCLVVNLIVAIRVNKFFFRILVLSAVVWQKDRIFRKL